MSPSPSEVGGPVDEPVSPADAATIEAQLGRVGRGMVSVAHRCPCGCPDVVRTEPRLPDGTPFPTTFYATCPRLTGAISTLEASGLMKEMTARLADDAELRGAYEKAHAHYLEQRAKLGHVEEIDGISAGGMPTRVKCLHVLVGHSLAAGPGVNPLGDEALAMLPRWWDAGCCAPEACSAAATDAQPDAAQPDAAGADQA